MSELVVGEMYNVSIGDCCVAVEFTARYLGRTEIGEKYKVFRDDWDNGVITDCEPHSAEYELVGDV